MSLHEPGFEETTEIKNEGKIKEPPMYKVLLINDDYTSMDFVVDILTTVFHKTTEAAVQIMMNVHKNGSGLCGVYTYEVAETKVETVHSLAEENGYPLRSTMEKE